MRHQHHLMTSAAVRAGQGIVLERKDSSGGDDTGGSVNQAELKTAVERLGTAFEAFTKKTNEELAQIKKAKERGGADNEGADAVTKDEVKKLNETLDEYKARLDEFELKAKRPALAVDGKTELTGEQVEHKKGWEHFMRKGSDDGLLELQRKALSAGSDADGGYLVPTDVENRIDIGLRETSPMRGISTVQQTSFTEITKPLRQGGAESGWVGETSARPETDTPTLTTQTFQTMELYANPAATQRILDDSAVDIEQWLANEVEDSFARQETAAFVSGDGNLKPKGLLAYTLVANSAWEWGKVGMFYSGAAGDFVTTNPGDEQDILIDTIFSLDEKYRANARWLFNKNTQARIRKIRDADGNPVWAPNLAAGQPSSLMGYPITELGNMPNLANNALAMAFGDFRRAYLILDRIGVRVLRDPYTNKPFVMFYTTKRVGGAVQDFEAYKVVRFGVAP